jgi:inorganic pyrophosphatase
VWGEARDLRDLPHVLIERLQHYFLTYRLVPGEKPQVDIAKVYGRTHAVKVVKAAMDDYVDMFAR